MKNIIYILIITITFGFVGMAVLGSALAIAALDCWTS